VIFTIHGAINFQSHIHQYQYFTVYYSVLKPLDNRTCLVFKMSTHQLPAAVKIFLSLVCSYP